MTGHFIRRSPKVLKPWYHWYLELSDHPKISQVSKQKHNSNNLMATRNLTIWCLIKYCVLEQSPDVLLIETPQIAKFLGPTGGPAGSCPPQMGPMLAQWTLLPETPCHLSRTSCGCSLMEIGCVITRLGCNKLYQAVAPTEIMLGSISWW